jgi:CBS domain-containing protein
MIPAPSPFIQSLLQRNFVSALPTATIGSIIDLLKEHRIGAVVITDGEGRLAGILSERDIVRALPGRDDLLDDVASSIMTSEVITTGVEATSSELMQAMTENRIRHIPILDGERIIGIVSIGDVVKRLLEKYEIEARHLKEFIYS